MEQRFGDESDAKTLFSCHKKLENIIAGNSHLRNFPKMDPESTAVRLELCSSEEIR